MRNLSSLIASTPREGEQKSAGAWAAGLFVAGLLAASAVAAFWLGNAIADPSLEPAPIAFAEESF